MFSDSDVDSNQEDSDSKDDENNPNSNQPKYNIDGSVRVKLKKQSTKQIDDEALRQQSFKL